MEILNDTEKGSDTIETMNIASQRTYSKISVSSCSFDHKFVYNKVKVLLLTLNASLGFLVIGYTIGVFNEILPRLAELKQWGDSTTYYESFLSASVGAGAILGGFLSGYILKKFGRRKCFIFYDILAIIGCCLTVIDYEVVMIIGRTVSGMCVGGYMTLVPVYISEFVPYEITGSSGAIYEVHFCIGLLISYLIGFGLPYEQTADNHYWRFMVGFPIIFCLINIFVLLFVFTYDTPRYLYINKNNKEESKECLSTIYYLEDDVKLMLKDLNIMVNCQNTNISIWQVLSPEYRTRFIVSLSVIITQQSCGIDVYFMLSESIFREHIDDKTLSTILTNFIGISQFIAGVIAIFITDKIGRRKLLVWGQIMLVSNSLALSIFYWLELYDAAVYFFITFVFINGITLSPVAFIYCTDLLPENIYAIGVVFNNVANLGVTFSYPFLSKTFLNIGGTICIYTVFIAINLILCILFAKETKDKSSKEIDRMFNPNAEKVPLLK
jgi:MFS family permease